MALYVQPLQDTERRTIEQYMRHPEHDLPRNRLQIVVLSAQGKRVPEISKRVNLHPINVRKWIHRFNESGLEGLRSGKSPGRPPLFTNRQRQQIVTIASTNPRRYGLQFSRWSLQRLRNFVIENGVVDHISVETVRQIIQPAVAAEQQEPSLR